MSAKSKFFGRFTALLGVVGVGLLAHNSGSAPGQAVRLSAEPLPAPVTTPLAITVNVDRPAEPDVASEPAPVAVGSMEEAGFDSTPFAIHSNRLMADWHQYDQARRIASSPWTSLLSEIVDPLFTERDGWHFYNPDTLGGFHESVRRTASFSLAGGLKFSRSF